MKRTNKARPAWAERAGGGSGDVGNVLSYPYHSIKPDPCQAMSGGWSFRADVPRHIGNMLAEVAPNIKKRPKGDGTSEPESGAFGGACEYGRSIAWIDVYVKVKVAFRQKALCLLKGAKLSCFVCLGLHMDGKGECYPSIDTMRADFNKLRYEFAYLVSPFQEKIDVYQECFEDIKDRWNSVQQFIAEDLEAVDVDLDDHPLPEPDLPPENNGTLYVSERDYLEQLQHYRAYRHGEEVDDG